MSNPHPSRNIRSSVSPALIPAIFIFTLIAFLVPQAAAEELPVKVPPTVGWDDRPHPVHPRTMLSVTELDFGVVGTNGLSEMSVTVTNTSPGSIPLKIALSHGCEGFVLPGGQRIHHLDRDESVEIPVVFSPLAPGDYACLLEFGNQVPAVPLYGTGGPLLEGVELDLEALDFGAVIVGFSNTLYLKITNLGAEAFILDPRLADDPSDFVITPGLEGYSLDPGTFAYLTMDFAPTVAGPASTTLYLGAGLPALDVSGTGIEPFGACEVNPPALVFGPLSPGESQAQTLKVTNVGNIPLDIAPSVDDQNFSVTMNSTVILPGKSWVVLVTYTPLSWGTHTALVDLGSGFCDPVECTGLPTADYDPTQDNVGLYFDMGLTTNRTTTTTAFEVVDFYLAMLNPSNTSGIAGWECRLGIDGDAALVSTVLEGNALNVGTGTNFIVGIGGAPLPYAPAVLLASFQMVKLGYPEDPVALELAPLFNPSLPGLMSWLSWDDVSDLKPMFPVGGDPVVAMINDPGKDFGKLPVAPAGVDRILPNVPNPFNPQTEIRFELGRPGRARVAVYDVTGRLVKTVQDGYLGAGPHVLVWQGRDDGGRAVASGTYYLRMETAGGVWNRKMTLLK